MLPRHGASSLPGGGPLPHLRFIITLLTLPLLLPALCSAALSSFTPDTIAIPLPPLAINCSIAEEIVSILSRHWIIRKTDWAELREALGRCSSMNERSNYLGSLGDQYCRLIRPADMATKSFRGTSIASGITLARDYTTLLRGLWRQRRFVLTGTASFEAGGAAPLLAPHSTTTPFLSARDAVSIATHLVLPLSFLALHCLPAAPLPRRTPLLLTLYRAGLSALIARNLAQSLCPVQVKDTHRTVAETFPAAPATGDQLLFVNGRRASVLSTHRLQTLLDKGEVATLNYLILISCVLVR